MKSCNHKVPTVYTSEVRKWQENGKVQKVPKSDKKYGKDYMKGTCTSSDYGKKHVQSCKKISIKLYEELCSQGSPCLYMYIEGEKRLSSQCGKKVKKKKKI